MIGIRRLRPGYRRPGQDSNASPVICRHERVEIIRAILGTDDPGAPAAWHDESPFRHYLATDERPASKAGALLMNAL